MEAQSRHQACPDEYIYGIKKVVVSVKEEILTAIYVQAAETAVNREAVFGPKKYKHYCG